MAMSKSGVRGASQGLVEELMGTVVTIDFVLRTLMALPEDALPGADKTEAMRRLLTDSACSEVEAFGEEACRAATALIDAVVGRIADDVSAVAQLTEASGQRPC